MMENMNRLLKIGFEPAGKWLLAASGLQLILDDGVVAQESNVLYAFAIDGSLAYVGKTTQSLQKRMQGYKSPAGNGDRGGSTNIKNNRNIITALRAGHAVDIFVLRSKVQQQHGEFKVNLSAGLEDSLISALSPPWNGRAQAVPIFASTQVRVAQHDSSANDQNTGAGVPAGPRILGGVPITPSAETLFSFARSQRGETLLTTRRKSPFCIEVVGNFLEITPGSSRTPRRESRDSVAAVLARLAKTASFQMSDYQDLSFNASYVLALVTCWQAGGRVAELAS